MNLDTLEMMILKMETKMQNRDSQAKRIKIKRRLLSFFCKDSLEEELFKT